MNDDLDILRERTLGNSQTGIVNLRSFDEGVVTTLKAVLDPELQQYFLHIRDVDDDIIPSSEFHRGPVDPRPGLPAIPVSFASPEDVFNKYSIPMIFVRRESQDPALERWHPGSLQYRAPPRGALPIEVGGVTGFTVMEETQQAVPFDFSYSVNILARNRGAPGIRNQVNRILDYVLRIYQPYCKVFVKDSVGDLRSYDGFMESISNLDEVAGVTDRVVGFAVSLRISGELDLNDPYVQKTVTQAPTFRAKRI